MAYNSDWLPSKRTEQLAIKRGLEYLRSKLLSAALCVALFSSCFSPYTGEATIILNLAGSSQSNNSESRAAIESWPPQDHGILDQIDYVVTLSGTGGEQTFTAKGGTTIRETVSPGTYTIDIKATVNDERYATGTHTGFEAKAGNNTVQIQMNKWFYQIGDTGPGGGIIFYVATGGFLLYGMTAPENKTVHYLEVGNNPTNCAWWASAGGPDIPLTQPGLGYGRVNTQYIMTAPGASDAHAASHCANYTGGGKTDWFLPSQDELVELIECAKSNTAILAMLLDLQPHWSSTQAITTNAYLYGGTYIMPTSYAKTANYRVAPIRAF